jgi:diacylglycerol kinase (ATP)
MIDPNDSFLVGRLKSIKYALRGTWILITTEDSVKVQMSCGVLVTILGFYFQISAVEWMMQTLVIGLILVAESANTAIEKIADFVNPQYHKQIEVIKDVAAGAPSFAAFTALVIGGIIYIPRIIALF